MLGTLNVSQSGLNAARIAVENVSNNLANENTPGYKKRVVELNELAQTDSRFTGRGVSSTSSYRVTSQYMYDKMISENTKTNYYDKLSNMLKSVESIFSETDKSGFSSDLNRYFQSIENLRTNPNSEIYKTTLKNSGNIIVESLQNLYKSVEQQQAAEKNELNVNVNKVNSILKEIGGLNEKLEKYATVTNDLLDKRDQLELELSNYVDINVSRDNGFYELKIAGEIAISNNTNVRTLNVLEEKTPKIDKFTTIDYSTIPNLVKDSLKYNEDLTLKSFNTGDIVTYRLNNEHDISVTIGESVTMDWDNDSLTADTAELVTTNNLTRALVHKINTNADTKNLVTAYNGDYAIDSKGEKVINNTKDNFLRIESNFNGIENQFDGRISIERIAAVLPVPDRESIYKNDVESREPESKVTIAIYEKDISLKSGMIRAQVDNLSSTSSGNKYQSYLDKLDSFAQTLSDLSDKYIKSSSNNYIYGEAATDESSGTITSVGLFGGSNVKTLKFNENSVNDLTQNKLDYLATLQWKTDLSFDGLGQKNDNPSKSISLLEFFRDLKVGVSADKENNDFLKDTQRNINQSLKSSYKQLTKVDKDEEMLSLIKFQAAYTANAKMVTVIDEMLQTLLGLKR